MVGVKAVTLPGDKALNKFRDRRLPANYLFWLTIFWKSFEASLSPQSAFFDF